MKKFLIAVILSLFCQNLCSAETQKDLFDNGVRQFKQGQYQGAVDTFSRLIEKAPSHADAYKNRGVAYMKLEQFDAAIADFERARELFPELRGLYSNLGVAWYYKKDYEKAIDNYNIEIEMDPGNSVAWFNRALCQAELGRDAEALKDLEKTLTLTPDFYWALCYKGDLLARTGETQKAVAAYESALGVETDNAYARDRLAELGRPSGKENIARPAKKDRPKTDTTHKGEAAAGKDRSLTVQSGAFLGQANAERMKARLLENGFDARIMVLKDTKNRTWYLVRSGTYTNSDQARKALAAIQEKLGITPVVRPAGEW